MPDHLNQRALGLFCAVCEFRFDRISWLESLPGWLLRLHSPWLMQVLGQGRLAVLSLPVPNSPDFLLAWLTEATPGCPTLSFPPWPGRQAP